MAKRAKKEASAQETGAKRGRKAGFLTNFSRLVSTERKRLQKMLDNALIERSTIDRHIAGIQQELSAVGIFLSKKLTPSGWQKKAPRGQKREQVLDAIKASPNGLTRGEVIQKLNAKDRSAQQSVSNSLANLFKTRALKRSGRKYLAA